MKPKHLALILGSALTSQAAADCGDDATNLLQNSNCDFDTDITGWGSTVAAEHDTTQSTGANGAPPGSGSITNQTDATSVVFSSPCANASIMSGETLNYGAAFAVSGGVEDSCSVAISFYPMSNCQGTPENDSTPFAFTSTTFSVVSGSFMTTAAAQSVLLQGACQDGGPAKYFMDNAFVSATTTVPVELEQFEID